MRGTVRQRAEDMRKQTQTLDLASAFFFFFMQQHIHVRRPGQWTFSIVRGEGKKIVTAPNSLAVTFIWAPAWNPQDAFSV